MNVWDQNRLIDILSHIDLSLLEDCFLERDLKKTVPPQGKRRKRHRVRPAGFLGIAASLLTLGGAALFWRLVKRGG